MPFLETFDGASIVECYRRPVSIVPQQALALSNSTLSLKMARLVAKDLTASGTSSESNSDSEFIRRAFERVLTRPPTRSEKAHCMEFLHEQTKLFVESDKLTLFSGGMKAGVPPSSQPSQRAKENLVHVLLNHNDYVTIR